MKTKFDRHPLGSAYFNIWSLLLVLMLIGIGFAFVILLIDYPVTTAAWKVVMFVLLLLSGVVGLSGLYLQVLFACIIKGAKDK